MDILTIYIIGVIVSLVVIAVFNSYSKDNYEKAPTILCLGSYIGLSAIVIFILILLVIEISERLPDSVKYISFKRKKK